MHLVDRHRRVQPVAAARRLAIQSSSCHAWPVGPSDDAGGRRAQLEAVARTGRPSAARRRPGLRISNLYRCPGGEAGDEELPDADVAARPHRVAPAVPAVEVADDADAPRVRRPDRERMPATPSATWHVRAEEPVGVPVLALAEQVQVEVADLRRETVRVVGRPGIAVLVLPAQAVVQRDAAGVATPLEEVGVGHALERNPGLLDAPPVRASGRKALTSSRCRSGDGRARRTGRGDAPRRCAATVPGASWNGGARRAIHG